MLSHYHTVYFKPIGGSGGFNIIRIRTLKHGYQTQYNSSKSTFPSLNRLYDYLNRFSRGKPFILQKGIRLARSAGKPFDIRVMVRKTNRENG
jgi:hypothetical protein